MKKVMFLAVALGAAFSMTSCKNQEAAYRAAYEKAKAQEAMQTTTTTPVEVVETTTTTEVTTPATTTTATDADFRTIKGAYSVIKGAPLNAYGVVVGSFSLQANAEGLFTKLTAQGLTPSIVKTNETISGITGWYRVVAASYDDKNQAAQKRDQLRGAHSGAWLLYHK